uniref:Uncharacterized protein n=1 Tax=Citrobacter freundii TaxID=546 RepID=A0A2R4AKK5_CITFR|nr:hypothetical protein [Citrobacter freundii]
MPGIASTTQNETDIIFLKIQGFLCPGFLRHLSHSPDTGYRSHNM